MACRICGEEDTRNRLGAYRRCGVCACLFLDPFPAQETNAPFMGEAAAQRLEHEDRARGNYHGRHLNRLERHRGRPPGGDLLLEIGCGVGGLLAAAAARGWRPAGVEMSPALAHRSRRRLPQARIVTGDIIVTPELFGDCAAVVALDVLEHVTAPKVFLARCRQALAPGGLLLLQTPNAGSLRCRAQGERWEMLLPDQHLHLFAPAALADLLDQAGFTVLERRTVSGSGRERGLARLAAGLKESLLNLAGWGNGLLVIARREG